MTDFLRAVLAFSRSPMATLMGTYDTGMKNHGGS